MLTHSELKKAIRNKYPFTHWLLVEEVSNASGFEGTRSIDAVAFGLYASRGYEIHAFECKASRSDWLKELNNPDKADEFVQLADKFWIVANKNVVKKEELPVNWGLIVVNAHGDGYRSRITKQAVPSEAKDDLPRPFVASMLTRLRKRLKQFEQDSVLKSEIQDKLDKQYEQGRENAQWEMKNSEKDLIKLKDQVDAFKEASGISLSQYGGGKELGEKVALVEKLERQNNWHGFLRYVGNMARTLQTITDDFLKKVEDLDKDREKLFKED